MSDDDDYSLDPSAYTPHHAYIHHRPADSRQAILDLTRERDAARAEVERLTRHIEELQSKIDAEKSCACSYDAPGDVCATHSPALAEARVENSRLRALIGEYFREPETHPVEREG